MSIQATRRELISLALGVGTVSPSPAREFESNGSFVMDEPTTTALLSRAQQLLTSRQYKESEAAYRQLLADGSHTVDSLYGIGCIRFATGELDEAGTYFTKCISLSPAHAEHANALYYLGLIAEFQHHGDTARNYFQRAVFANPTHAAALRKLAAKPSSPPTIQRLGSDPQTQPSSLSPSDGKGGNLSGGSTASDFYALIRRSDAPADREIATLLDDISAIIGVRRARLLGYLGEISYWLILGLLITLALEVLIAALPGSALEPIRHILGWTALQMQAVVLQVGLTLTLLATLATVSKVKARQVRCERDFLLMTTGVLRRSTESVQLLFMCKSQPMIEQSLCDRVTRMGTLVVGDRRLQGFMTIDELNVLAERCRRLSLLNPTSREVLTALGELKNIRSGV
jgi:tetratricopeptide (TPR) repeat protein